MKCRQDPSSFANTHEIRTESIHLDLAVDFNEKRLSGSATLDLVTDADANLLILDSSYLDITKIVRLDENAEIELKVCFASVDLSPVLCRRASRIHGVSRHRSSRQTTSQELLFASKSLLQHHPRMLCPPMA